MRKQTYDLGEGEVLLRGVDDGRLDEKLVLALCAGRRVGPHRLEEDWEKKDRAGESYRPSEQAARSFFFPTRMRDDGSKVSTSGFG